MNPSYHTEYQALISGIKNHLMDHHKKGSFVLAEKENWETLRRLMTTAKKSAPLPQPPSPSPKPVAAKPSIPVAPAPAPISAPAKTPPVVQITAIANQAEAPPAPKRVVEEKISRSLALAETVPIPSIDFEPWKAIFKEKFPHVVLIDTIEKPTVEAFGVTIVFDAATPREIAFLQNVARTTQTLLGPTKIIHVSKLDTKKRSLIVSYKAGVDNDLAIDDISVYLQSPGVKAQLWRTLSNTYMQKSS